MSALKKIVFSIYFILFLFSQEKSYFIDSSKQKDDPEYVFMAIQKCLDDYNGEIKHIKGTLKEVNKVIFRVSICKLKKKKNYF